MGAKEPQKQAEVNLDDKDVTRKEYDDLRSKYEELYSYLETATKPEGGKHGESLV